MLVEFKVANFRSFREEQTLSLVASKDEKLPGNLIPAGRFNLLKSAALYGANASGKSNLFKAMAFFSEFVRSSATKMNQGDAIEDISPFRLDTESRTRPTMMEASFLVDGTLYRYGFSATRQRVFDEWLAVTLPEARSQVWFERHHNASTGKTEWCFKKPIRKEERNLLKERTRDNGLVLSRGAELNIGPLTSLFRYLQRRLWCIDCSGIVTPLVASTAQFIRNWESLGQKVLSMVRDADLTIDDIRVVDEPSHQLELPINLSVEAKDLFSSPVGTSKHPMAAVAVKATHRIPGSDLVEQFDLRKEESNGTRRLFALAGPLVDALEDGAVVVVDEIDCSMHPILTRKLIELFQSPETNTKGAQLIFTTHDSSLMDINLFRRDQVWIAEKKNSCATELFSLYDIEERPRNTEALERNYLAGRYGGVPHLGATFEDLVLK